MSGYNGLGVNKKTDNNSQLTDAEIAAMGYKKTDNDTQLTDAEIAAMGYKKTDNDTQLTDAEIAAMGYKKTDNDTQLTDAEIAAMGYKKTGIVTTYFTHIIPNGDTNDVIDIFKDYFTNTNLQPNKTFDIDFFISMDSVPGNRQGSEMYQLVFKIGNYDSILSVGEYVNDNFGSFDMLYRFKFYCDANTRVWYNNEGYIKKDNYTVSKLMIGEAAYSPKANILAGNSFEVQQVSSKGQMTINAVIKEY